MKRSAGGRLRGDKPAKSSLAKPAAVLVAPAKLVGDVCRMIEAARRSVVATVNIELTMLYWRVGARIRTEVLRDARAAYGEQVIVALAQKLQRDYGRGFSEKTLRRMVQLADVFPDEAIVATLSRQLTWSHFALLLPLEAPLARAFYAEMCRTERWSVRVWMGLKKRVNLVNGRYPQIPSPSSFTVAVAAWCGRQLRHNASRARGGRGQAGDLLTLVERRWTTLPCA